MTTRRSFVQTSVSTALALTHPASGTRRTRAIRETRALVGLYDLPHGAVADPVGVRLLAQRALDAAHAAGAPYADVRLTRRIREQLDSTLGVAPTDEEHLAIGIRVLIGGCWGFAARSRWSLDEIPSIATEAVQQAKANAMASPQPWTPAPRPVASGDWQPPTAVDPFVIAPEEKLEHLQMLATYLLRQPLPIVTYGTQALRAAQVRCDLTRTEWALATSDGSYCTQRRYTAEGDMRYTTATTSVAPTQPSWAQRWATLPWWGRRGQGWEYCAVETAYPYIESVIAQHFAEPSLARTPVEVGRYDVVCAAPLTAELVGRMFGPPLELDRILGLEANAGGTSYVPDPLAALGTLSLGSPLLTVTGNRTDVGGLATAPWDDDGVVPPTTALLTDGVLTDYFTTRQSASCLAPWAAQQGKSVRSTGCAAADSALSIPLAHPPNLALAANREDVGVDDLVRDTKQGIAVLAGTVDLDFQGRTGMVNTQNRGSDVVPLSAVEAREIVNGKLGRALDNVAVMFNVLQLWKGLHAVGGEKSRQSAALESTKGEPAQTVAYTASAAPVKLTNVTIVDTRRGL